MPAGKPRRAASTSIGPDRSPASGVLSVASCALGSSPYALVALRSSTGVEEVADMSGMAVCCDLALTRMSAGLKYWSRLLKDKWTNVHKFVLG
jgi:hypothetical protein